jgi:hypothetical protein
MSICSIMIPNRPSGVISLPQSPFDASLSPASYALYAQPSHTHHACPRTPTPAYRQHRKSDLNSF